jgi:hypothetical protein
VASSDGEFVDYLKRLGRRKAEAELGDHPEPEVLLAYHRGELDPAAADAVEEHVTFCTSCADLVLAIPAFLAEDRETDHYAEEPQATGPVVPFPARETARRWRWLPLAAGLVVGLGVGFGSGRLGTTAPGASFLVGVSEDARGSRGETGEPVVLDFRGGQAVAVVVLTPQERVGKGPFRGRIMSEAGRLLVEDSGLTPTQGGTFVLVVPRGSLAAGESLAEVLAADGSRVASRTLRVLADP